MLKMKNSLIYDNFQKVTNKQTSFEEIVKDKIQLSENSIKNQDNIVLDIFKDEAINAAKNIDASPNKDIYSGVTFFLKDNINYLNKKTTSGSKIMNDFVSVFNATIVDNIIANNGIILGKLNLDELGHAGTGTFSAFGLVRNPLDPTRITGGSSSGSAAAIKLELCDVAIGTDTGDSIRHPASFLGLVGYKPSYGLVSRYGVTPFASSLDHVGVLTRDVVDAAIGIDMMKGFDSKDFTSIDVSKEKYFDKLTITDKKYKILVLDDVAAGIQEHIKPKFDNFINDLKIKQDVSFDSFGLELLQILSPLYMATSYMEGSSNWSNVNGILFGAHDDKQYKNYNELITKAREQFGHEVKSRYMISNFFTSSDNFDIIYQNSVKIRRIVVNRINELLGKYDAVLIPSSSSYAPLLDDVLHNKLAVGPNYCDDALMIANFSGVPSITIPLTSEQNPNAFGINLMGLKYTDDKLLNIAYNLESLIKERGYYDK